MSGVFLIPLDAQSLVYPDAAHIRLCGGDNHRTLKVYAEYESKISRNAW